MYAFMLCCSGTWNVVILFLHPLDIGGFYFGQTKLMLILRNNIYLMTSLRELVHFCPRESVD